MDDTTNPLYQLLDKQATEFELFGQRLKSETQNSYQEFIKLQQQQQKSRHEITQDEPSLQSELISSLKARVEELETDSIIKNQNIEEQKIEIQQLKQELDKHKNGSEVGEFKNMKQEIEELNDFKNNFMLLFDSFEQIKSEVNVLKSNNNIENDRSLAEKLEKLKFIEKNEKIPGLNPLAETPKPEPSSSSSSSSPYNDHNQSASGLKPKGNDDKETCQTTDEEFDMFISTPILSRNVDYKDVTVSGDENDEDVSDTPGIPAKPFKINTIQPELKELLDKVESRYIGAYGECAHRILNGTYNSHEWGCLKQADLVYLDPKERIRLQDLMTEAEKTKEK